MVPARKKNPRLLETALVGWQAISVAPVVVRHLGVDLVAISRAVPVTAWTLLTLLTPVELGLANVHLPLDLASAILPGPLDAVRDLHQLLDVLL